MMDSEPSSGRSAGANAKKNLPWVAFFWDIENCVVPPTKSAAAVAKFFRERFGAGRRERDFFVVCDTVKGNPTANVIEKLALDHVTIVHIPSGAKNAADDKLKSMIRKYADTHSPGDVVVLISGDINFTTELQQVKYEHNMEVIIVHPENINPALVTTAKEHYIYGDLIAQVPFTNQFANAALPATGNQLDTMIFLTELPTHVPENSLRAWLSQYASPQGGYIAFIKIPQGTASIVYKSMDGARRGRVHFDGLNAFGKLVVAKFSPKSVLFAEQEAQNEGRPRAAGVLPSSNSSSGLPTLNGGSPPRTTLHGSASFPNKPSSVRPPPAAPSRFEQTRAFPGFTPYENGNATGPSIRLSNGMAHMPAAVNGSGIRPSVLSQPAPVDNDGANKLSFFKRSQLEKEAKAKAAAAEKKLAADAEMAALKEQIKKSDSAARTAGKKQPSQQLQQETADQLARREQIESLTGAFAKSDLNGGSGGESSPDNCSTKNELSNLYFLNLNTDIEQDALYYDLLTRLEEVAPVEHLSLYMDSVSSAYAHAAFVGAATAQNVIAAYNGFMWNGRPMELTQEDPSKPAVPKNPPNPGVFVAVQRAVVRLFLTLKKEEMSFAELVTLFRREYDQGLDLKTLKLVPDIVTVKEQRVGLEKNPVLTVALAPTAAQYETDLIRQRCLEALPLGYCEKHCPGGATNGILLRKFYKPLGLYRVRLKDFSTRTLQLLAKHNGSLPLNSFLVCYDEFGQKLVEDLDNGCYLEHLLLSIPGVGIRYQTRTGPRLLEKSAQAVVVENGILADGSGIDVAALGEAVKDMLVLQPRSAVALSDFPAALHRHCGNNLCDLRGYDQSRLVRLLRPLSGDIELIGVGAEQVVTLAHKAQLARFAEEWKTMHDLCGEEIDNVTAENIGAMYQVAFERKFWVGNYGVSDFADLLEGATELLGAAGQVEQDQPSVVACPPPTKRPESIERLAQEAFQQLVASPDYREGFIQFPQNYHKLYSRVLRKRDYGCNSLMEVLGTIPDVAELEFVGNAKENRYVRLQKEKRLKHLGQVIESMSAGITVDQISVADFKKEFVKLAGIEYKRENYGDGSDQEVLAQFSRLLEVETQGRKSKLSIRFLKRNNQNGASNSTVLSTSERAVTPCSSSSIATETAPAVVNISEVQAESTASAGEVEIPRVERPSPFKPSIRLAMHFH